ncbi:hypothetical protein Pfo_009464 [Paulownia fortunei]|nr:hypothetical protein Pfo_009464 [Paulownia fortunei]
MLSLTTTRTHISKSHHLLSRLNCHLIPSCIFMHNPKNRDKRYSRRFGFIEVKTWRKVKGNFDNSWCCWCKRIEGDIELEEEIIEFMEKSEKPTMFPTKEELLRAGRMELVEATKKRGGWYSLGWDEENVGDNVEEAMGFDIGEFQRRVENCKYSASLREQYNNSFSGHEKDDGFSSAVDSNSWNLNYLQLASSASLGRSLINLDKYGCEIHATSKGEGDDRHFNAALDVARTDLGESSSFMLGFHHKGFLNTFSSKISPNIESETWRTWSNQQAGSQHTEFEAAEISFSKNQVESNKETYHDGITVTTEEYAEAWVRHEDISHNQIQTRLQHLEFELTTALHSLRSKREECFSEEVIGSSSDLLKLSDAWEFQENEFMSAQKRLRSIRANLAVLEGKMALAIIDAQKKVEEKQKRIDGAHIALQLLRSTCIVWPNSASEVLLAGSFDRWTTKRKMEKSRTGILSISLKLYPGRYEIKFIVNGIWKVDPLRPIIKNNGYENNLLDVT